MKRILGILLALMLVVTLVPAAGINAPENTADAATTTYKFLDLYDTNGLSYLTADGHYYRLKVTTESSKLQYKATYGGTWKTLSTQKTGDVEFGHCLVTNGKKVFFSKVDYSDFSSKIYSVNTDGSNLTLLKKMSGFSNAVNYYGGELYFARTQVSEEDDITALYSINVSTKVMKKRSASYNMMITVQGSGNSRYIVGRKYDNGISSLIFYDCRENRLVKTIKGITGAAKGRNGKVYFLKENKIDNTFTENGTRNCTYELRRVNIDGTSNVALAKSERVGSAYGIFLEYPDIWYYMTDRSTETEVYFEYNCSTKEFREIDETTFWAGVNAVG